MKVNIFVLLFRNRNFAAARRIRLYFGYNESGLGVTIAMSPFAACCRNVSLTILSLQK
jgi:hypothetical protein